MYYAMTVGRGEFNSAGTFMDWPDEGRKGDAFATNTTAGSEPSQQRIGRR